MYKAILFDLDGTLTESGEGITKSVQYALEKLGKPAPSLEELRVFVGPPLMEQFMKFANLDEETARLAVSYYRERYSTIGIFENRVYPGIEEMLGTLRKKGYLLAVASSKPEKFVLQILEHFHLLGYFHEVVGSEMNGNRTNKAAVVEEALKRLGLSDKRDAVLMVGDKEHDVLGARACGLECIAVSYGYGTMEELQAAEPLKIAASAGEILDFFRLSPLRRQSLPGRVWRGLSPLVLFLCIYQILGSAVLVLLAQITGYGNEGFQRFSILITGITGMITIIPAVYLYRKDRDRRVFGRLVSNPPGEKLNVGECGLLLLLGAGLAFYVNLFVGILQIFVQDSTYQNMMESITTGYSLPEMILWMGIVAPLAEETIFRWLMYLRLRDYMKIPAAAILSGLIFGVFHGNFVQIIYAGILGVVMAYILEMSGNLWSSALLHIGANVFSLLLTEAAPKLLALEGTPYAAMANTAVLTLYGILLAAVIFGISYFVKKGKKRGYRAI